METLVQNRPVAFHAITLSEAIVMAPLMDELKRTITELAKNNSVPVSDERLAYMAIPEKSARNIAFILSKMGFRTSDGAFFSNPKPEDELQEPSPCDVFQDMTQKEINEVK